MRTDIMVQHKRNKNECGERENKGGKKMNEILLITKEAKECVNSRMPSLSEEDIAWAGEHMNRQWAHGMMAGLIGGQVHWFGSDGIMMQKVDDGTVRILSMIDHEWCFRQVAYMRATFEAVSVEVELDPYTVLMPYVEPAEAEQVDAPGEPSGVEVA